MKVAITGISGYIGRRVFRRLAETEAVERIVGIDVREPPDNSPKLKFYRRDISQPLGEIFSENQVNSVIHLAFVLKPARDRARTRRTDIDGTVNLLEACHEAKVGYLLYLSSHTVYGAHADNYVPVTEESPLRPLFDFQYSWDKVEVEKALHDFAVSHPQTGIAILRSCPVAGPGAADSVAALMFKPPVMIAVRGYDPPMQFLHEDDLSS